MTQQELIKQLQELKQELHIKFGIEKIALFGSYARDEATQSSDVDIVIIEAKDKQFLNRLNAKKMIEERLGLKVDLGYFESMKTFIKNRIQKELIYV